MNDHDKQRRAAHDTPEPPYTTPTPPPPAPPSPGETPHPVRDPQTPEHPDPVREPPGNRPPMAASAWRVKWPFMVGAAAKPRL